MSKVIKLDSFRRKTIDGRSITSSRPSVPKLHRSGIPDRLKYEAGQSEYQKAYIDGFNCAVTKMENEQLLTQLGILT